MSDRTDRTRPRRPVDDPATLVGVLIGHADQEGFLLALLDRDDQSAATRRLRVILSERREAWLVAASWLAQRLYDRARPADDQMLWTLAEQWAVRGGHGHLGEQAAVWTEASSLLAVALVLRAGDAGCDDRSLDEADGSVGDEPTDEDELGHGGSRG